MFQNQTNIPFSQGSLCHQLVFNALSERGDRNRTLLDESSSQKQLVLSSSLTMLRAKSSILDEKETNPHENFYRDKFEH